MTATVRPIESRLAAAGLPALPRLAWLELDLDALAANLGAIRAMVGPVGIHPVVKADAYGHGAVPIARALAAAGADGFCVAAMDEALALREGGVRAPIRVMYPVPSAFAAEAARRSIMVAAGDLSGLADLVTAAEAAGVGSGRRRRLGIELEIETGLGRGGIEPARVVEAAGLIAASSATRLSGLWTHLQATEDAALTSTQSARFDAAADALRGAGLRLPARHVAASGGLLTDVADFDGIRPGLIVYGIVPDELDPDSIAGAVRAAFRPVMSLHARPVRVADLPTGHGVSYGPTFVTSRPSRIATLPLGYGDGFTRANSNRAEALVRGQRVPLVGNVAMDGIMFDVTDVPGPPVDTRDEFVLLGAQGDERIRAEDLARTRTTNTWEVVTQMSARLPRVYHAAAAPVGLRTLTERRG